MELSAHRGSLVSIAIVAVLIGFAPPLAQTVFAQAATPASSPSPAEDGVRSATMLYYAAVNSALKGDLAPLSAVWSHRPDVSSLSAAGGRAVGWNEVYAGFQNMGRIYPSGTISQQDMLVVVGADMGYSVCTEVGQLRSAEGPMVHFNQRATNIFRLEDGRWKMIHHHADSNIANFEGGTR